MFQLVHGSPTTKLKFGLKISLKPNSSTKNDFKTKLKTELQFHTKVNPEQSSFKPNLLNALR